MQKHLDTIKKIKNNILELKEFLKESEHHNFKEYIDKKYNQYNKSFEEAFDPSRQINLDMRYFSDVRTLAKYNENLITGWLIEDFFIFLFKIPIFKDYNFKIEIESHDSDRIIKKERDYINSDPDFIVKHNNVDFKIEIQSLLINYHMFHIKKNKANRMLNNNSFIYHLNLQNKEIIFLNAADIKEIGKLTSIRAFGGKKGYEFINEQIPKNKKFQFDSQLLNKIIVTLYWFYLCKKYGIEDFHIKRNEILQNHNSIISLLKHIKESSNL